MRCGIACVISELPEPLSVRRLVCFSSAIHEGTLTVEGVTARRAESSEEAWQIMAAHEIPVMVDPDLVITQLMQPAVVVDGRMLKKADNSLSQLSTIVIGLGPGFYAGKDCRAVIETNRGPKMGRVISFGATEPDTGIPEQVNQFSNDRVLRAPVDGILKTFTINSRPGEGWSTDRRSRRHSNKSEIYRYCSGFITQRKQRSNRDENWGS